jgi:hypothetical protein
VAPWKSPGEKVPCTDIRVLIEYAQEVGMGWIRGATIEATVGELERVREIVLRTGEVEFR